jgi:EAL domain-containing protein (putative c-di-GMP-specific phosphodiesterase class I)
VSFFGGLGHRLTFMTRRSAASSRRAAHGLLKRSELHMALDRDELVLHYQPAIELATGRATCVEALLRWQHPQRGLLPPSEFLPLAEQQSELMGSLTRWVLRRALADYRAWTAAGQDWTVAVNISALDLASVEFAGTVGKILREACVRPDRLHLEVAETALAFNAELARDVVGALAAQGISMSLDDFGIGYTSSAQLGALQVSEIKIDRTFLAALPGDEQDRAVVRSLIDLGHSLGCRVTAEGVEWQEVADWLVDAGCDHAQGYLWLRPRAWTEVAQVFGETTAVAAAERRFAEPLGVSDADGLTSGVHAVRS